MSTGNLPPTLLIELARGAWYDVYRLMIANLAPSSNNGDYLRPKSEFRSAIGENYSAQCDRYLLIVGLACPWAHRTLIIHALKGLSGVIPIRLVYPHPHTGVWLFSTPESTCTELPQLYKLSNSDYGRRCTVPVLWDRLTKTIVNNDSGDLLVILNSQFNQWAKHPNLDFYPQELQSEIDRWNSLIYEQVNNGVYRCGFAQSQSAYNQAVNGLFDTLDLVDRQLETQPYLCGTLITIADIRLFTTLVRFDLVYYTLFKCQQRSIKDYPNLRRYLREIYHLPRVANTCNFAVIQRDYYRNLFPLNPSGMIPILPDLSYFIN